MRLVQACRVGFVLLGVALMTPGCPPQQTGGSYVVLGYNELGMHCMNQDFSEMMILPPYNTLHAQVIRRGGEPSITSSGVTVTYSIPGNTTSSNKTNFWTYAQDLFGLAAPLPLDIGLAGNGLAGSMTPTGNNDWSAVGIPITPLNDQMVEDPYPLATITVLRQGAEVATTQAVVPVSWEISCDLCHVEPGVSTATAILRAHDRLHTTTLEQQKPVMCGNCHAQAPLGAAGSPGLPSLSRAMHGAHAARMSMLPDTIQVACYACHPGVRTQCLRDVHASHGMVCTDCHGNMSNVADAGRRPWVDEPRCGDCHQRQNFAFEEPNKLFRESRGHNGVHCAACHGAPHAIGPTINPQDNVQAIQRQGHSGEINKCTVCHTQTPDDFFNHTLGEGGEDKG